MWKLVNSGTKGIESESESDALAEARAQIMGLKWYLIFEPYGVPSKQKRRMVAFEMFYKASQREPVYKLIIPMLKWYIYYRWRKL